LVAANDALKVKIDKAKAAIATENARHTEKISELNATLKELIKKQKPKKQSGDWY
jgi:hypothetical protein